MADARVERFRKKFPEWVFADITCSLRGGQWVAATLLCCCAIDYLSRFHSGDSAHSLNKGKYISFLERYFGSQYEPESFYKFVRCGLVHGYNMGRRYIVVGSSADWARSLHMRYDPKHKATLINPHILYEDLRDAFTQFLADLRANSQGRSKLGAVWKGMPFERPQLASDINKFKHLLSIPAADA